MAAQQMQKEIIGLQQRLISAGQGGSPEVGGLS